MCFFYDRFLSFYPDMKNRLSALALAILMFVFIGFRLNHCSNNTIQACKVTTWDAFGYYMYLPGTFIYQDNRELKWVDTIEQQYAVSGGTFYQASQLPSGTYTNKYLCGIAIMESPFFGLAHWYASSTNPYPADGFSFPYQFAMICAALCWTLLGLIFLRKVLLRYFNDRTTALTLLLTGLCTNLIQYVSVDSAQSHAFLFGLYALVLWLTMKWHDRPGKLYALLTGFFCGLAIISRPTELIIIFIPILWNTNPKLAAKEKWQLVAANKNHILLCLLGGLAGIAPQMVYWQYTTGSLIYDVGSKWYFLNPWFRVLFGPEKGWFLYTPISILMVLGLGYMKQFPFRNAVITFCLLNIWIIISWSDWRYGGSYATRALVQSYPVFALTLAGIIHVILRKYKVWIIVPVAAALVLLNFYQLSLYNSGIGESFSPLLKLWKS